MTTLEQLIELLPKMNSVHENVQHDAMLKALEILAKRVDELEGELRKIS